MKDFICSFLNQTGDLLNILGMVGIALLMILTPIAVAIFNNKKDDFDALDRVILNRVVVRARGFLIYIALVYIPILFWNVSSLTFRILEFVMWAVGIYLIVRVLIKAYDWMRGDTFMLLRLDYLRELKNPKDMEEPWRSVWEAKNITTQNEKEFFTIFSAAIDNLLKK